MTDRVLIIGDRCDVHVVAVLDALRALGGPEPVLLDAPLLMNENYSLVVGETLAVGPESIGLGPRTRGWLRRSAPTLWGAGVVTGSLESVRRRAFLSLVGSISRAGHRHWLTALDAMLRAEDRLLQLEIASGLGHGVPRTIVTSSGDVAMQILGDRFVVKPLAMGYFNTPAGPRAVYSTWIHR